MTAHFKDQDFQFGLEVALGCTYRQAADVGEVLATASRITDGDADSWVQEWTATAGASWTAGCLAQATGRRVSAVAHYRRAATYYATALYRISHADAACRARARTRDLAKTTRMLGAHRRPPTGPGRANQHPLRGHRPAGVFLPGARRGSRRASDPW